MNWFNNIDMRMPTHIHKLKKMRRLNDRRHQRVDLEGKDESKEREAEHNSRRRGLLDIYV